MNDSQDCFIFIFIDEHIQREITNRRSLKHPIIIRSRRCGSVMCPICAWLKIREAKIGYQEKKISLYFWEVGPNYPWGRPILGLYFEGRLVWIFQMDFKLLW